MKKNIAVVAGGDSSEYEISLQTASHIIETLRGDQYTPYLVIIDGPIWIVKQDDKTYTVDRNDFSFNTEKGKILFDFAYIAIHGTPGENGVLQGYFELLRIPHSTCNVLSSALSFNKHACNTYLKALGYTFARSILLKKNSGYNVQHIIQEVGLPCFVKPNDTGSSFGITKVKEASQMDLAIKNAFLESNEVIIEEFIQGVELTCGLVKTKEQEIIFPITEVIPKKEFFDYEAKYDPSMSEEITPARISQELAQRVQALSSEIYDALKCKGIVRIDYIIRDQEIFMLEANTVPGMTANSFIPKQVKSMNRDLGEILSLVIEDAYKQ